MMDRPEQTHRRATGCSARRLCVPACGAIFALGLCLVDAPTAHAQVSPGEWLFHAGPGLAGEPNLAGDTRGAALHGGVTFGLPRAFTLGVDAETLRLFTGSDEDGEESEDDPPRRAWGAHALHLSVGANVDVLTVVPWVSVGPGLVLGGQDPEAAPQPVFRIGLGFDYRPRRTWSSGAAVFWTTAGPDWTSLPDRALVVLRFGWILSPSAL